MEPRAHHILIGLFTIAGLGGALLFALWLSHASADRDYDYYEVGFERAVTGLAVGNPVYYNGVRVGDVLELRLDPDDPRLVRVLVRVFSDTPIHQDTDASLMLANITGSSSIQFHGGEADSPRLHGSREAPPLIIARPSPFGSLLAESENLLRGFENLLGSANRILDTENTDNLSAILRHVEQLSGALAAERGELTRAITQAGQAMDSLARLSDGLQDILDAEGRAILASARNNLQALEGVTSRLDDLAGSHEGTLEHSLQTIGDLQPVLRELRVTLRHLGRAAERLEDDPAGFLLGREPIKEFTP